MLKTSTLLNQIYEIYAVDHAYFGHACTKRPSLKIFCHIVHRGILSFHQVLRSHVHEPSLHEPLEYLVLNIYYHTFYIEKVFHLLMSVLVCVFLDDQKLNILCRIKDISIHFSKVQYLFLFKVSSYFLHWSQCHFLDVFSYDCWAHISWKI